MLRPTPRYLCCQLHPYTSWQYDVVFLFSVYRLGCLQLVPHKYQDVDQIHSIGYGLKATWPGTPSDQVEEQAPTTVRAPSSMSTMDVTITQDPSPCWRQRQTKPGAYGETDEFVCCIKCMHVHDLQATLLRSLG